MTCLSEEPRPVQTSDGYASSTNGSPLHASRISLSVPKLLPLLLQLSLSFWHTDRHTGKGSSLASHLGNSIEHAPCIMALWQSDVSYPAPSRSFQIVLSTHPLAVEAKKPIYQSLRTVLKHLGHGILLILRKNCFRQEALERYHASVLIP